MALGIDYHIHTHHLKCADETMRLEAIVRRAEKVGLTSIAITDHLNRPEHLMLHLRIREELEQLKPDIEVYFGVELNFYKATGKFPFNADAREALGFDFAIGGVHTTYTRKDDRAVIIGLQHAHHLLTCNDPLVEVLVHPWWFSPREFHHRGLRWFDGMEDIPEALHRELGRVARETGTAIELNARAIFLNPYLSDRFKADYRRYVKLLAEEGVRFAVASDAHSLDHLGCTEAVEDVLSELGVSEGSIWHPAHPPGITASPPPATEGRRVAR